jgi:hypothetical protein
MMSDQAEGNDKEDVVVTEGGIADVIRIRVPSFALFQPKKNFVHVDVTTNEEMRKGKRDGSRWEEIQRRRAPGFPKAFTYEIPRCKTVADCLLMITNESGFLPTQEK